MTNVKIFHESKDGNVSASCSVKITLPYALILTLVLDRGEWSAPRSHRSSAGRKAAGKHACFQEQALTRKTTKIK
jgi:hypothetical protein